MLGRQGGRVTEATDDRVLAGACSSQGHAGYRTDMGHLAHKRNCGLWNFMAGEYTNFVIYFCVVTN